MKKIFLLIVVSSLALVGCKERFNGINYELPPVGGGLILDSQFTTAGVPSSFTKVLLVEDFSGIKCRNCPDAAQKISGLDTTNPGRIVEMTLHSFIDGSLTDSFPGSKSSYRTVESDYLRGIMGGTNSLPELDLNRKRFDKGDPRFVFDRGLLQGYANGELALSSPAKISFPAALPYYDATTKTIKATIQVQYGAAISDSDYLSVALKENNIIDLQEKANGTATIVDSHYVHNGVLRKYIYPLNGKLLPSPGAGKTYLLSFSTSIPGNWNPDNIEIVAILHKQNAATNNFYVSQVAQTKIK